MRITFESGAGDAAAISAKRRKKAVEKLTGGFFACLGWGAAGLLFFRSSWVLFPLFFMGILPLISGLRELATESLAAPAVKKASLVDRQRVAERSILRVASERGGRVSPALVAVEAGLGLEEAQKALDEMVAKGHAELRVLDSGRLEYAFPEFEKYTSS